MRWLGIIADLLTDGKKWGDAGILTANLTNPNLLAAATQLSPGVLRIGGSPEDSITYDFDGACAHASITPSQSHNAYYCSQVHPAQYGCLTTTRWNEIVAFARQTGLKLVFGLNACYGRESADSPMDFSNIKALLSYIASAPEHHDVLFGFEFGNELTTQISAPTWANDVKTLHQLILATFGPKNPPHIIGPDLAPNAEYFDTILKMLQTPDGGNILHAVTYHEYPECVPQAGSSQVLPQSCLESVSADRQHIYP